MGFQTRVNLNPASGWHGDFASINPRVSVLGTQGGYQAGAKGVKVGSFVWVSPEDGTVSNQGTGSPDGFVAREMTGITTQYLQESSMLVPEGFMVTVYGKGEFLVELPASIASVNRHDKVFVDPETGEMVASDTEGAVETGYNYAENAKGGDMVMISAWI